jgi:Enoyl-(Acyl carrier protein) reductase
MIIKGGIHAITRSLAMEYAKDAIRVSAVAPRMVDTPLQRNSPKDFLKGLSPMGIILNVQEIVDAVTYLAEAPHVTWEVLYVDGGNDDDHSPDQFLDEANHLRQMLNLVDLEPDTPLSRLWVIRVDLAGPRRLPVYPGERTFSG